MKFVFLLAIILGEGERGMDSIEILYKDAAIIVCMKPRGVLSQTGPAGEKNMVDLLSQQLGGEIFPVHRLDKSVGGVMVYARTKSAAAELTRQIQQGNVKKEYLAVVHGIMSPLSGSLEDLLLHDKKRNKSYVVQRQRAGVKKALLSYVTLQTEQAVSLVQVRLFTGRTHQIRVQFSSRQHPLLGDGTYGGGKGTLSLWSVRLQLMHPVNKKQLCFAALPSELGPFFNFPPLKDMI